MKTKAILCCISILLSLHSIAQWRAGAKAGVNLSWFTQDIAPFARHSEYYDDYRGFNQHVRAGIHAGLTLQYHGNGPFSIGTEFLLSSRGSMYRIRNTRVILVDGDGNENKAYDTYTYKIDYIELPFYVHINPAYSRRSGISFYGGIAPAYAISSKQIYRYYDIEGVAAKGDQQKKSKLLNDARKIQVFPLAGIRAGNAKSYIDARLTYPLLPTFTKATNSDGSNLTTRSWSIGITGGINF